MVWEGSGVLGRYHVGIGLLIEETRWQVLSLPLFTPVLRFSAPSEEEELGKVMKDMAFSIPGL